MKYQQIFIYTLLWSTYFLCYCVRKPISIYKFYVESELHLSKIQLGGIDLALLLPYAVIQIIGANWWDKLNPKNILAGNLLLAALTLLLLSLTKNYVVFCLLVAICGAAQAPLWAVSIKTLDGFIPEKHITSKIG